MRVKLGTWELPSGGELDAYLTPGPDENGVHRLTCEWSVFPPSRADKRYYIRHLALAIAARAKRQLGKGGRVLWVLP
jgi:hypothetical protein